LTFAGKWIEMENIILSEVSQVQKTKSCMSSLICGIRPNTNISNIIYTLKFQKGLIEETKGEGKEGKKDSQ
jgi:hypothetical protein